MDTGVHTVTKKVKIAAYGVIVFVWVLLFGGLWFFIRVTFQYNVLGATVFKIDKENLLFAPVEKLKHFYEWKPNQTIVHERAWLPHTITAVTNNDGLIGEINYAIEKPQGVYRIIALGDSFTEGPYVENKDTYPKQLETILNSQRPCSNIDGFEVLNFGVGGYDIEYAANRFLTRGLKYQPDLILWFLKDDDFDELTEKSHERVNQYLARMTEEEKQDITKFEKYDQFEEEWNEPRYGLWEKIFFLVRKELFKELSQEDYLAVQTEAIQAMTKSYDKPILLFTFSDTDPRYKARMKLWSNTEASVMNYDGIPALQASVETFDPHDGHPNEKGYIKTAESIRNYLLAHHLLCP